MSYRQWNRKHHERIGRQYVGGYPWSMLYAVALPVGLIGVVAFQNVLPGLAGALLSGVLGLWYWKPGGRGRRSIGDA